MTKGEKIKSARIALGMTMDELAKACNTTKQTIYKYESGTVSNIPSDRMETICEVLGITPSYLMGWEDALEELAKQKVEEDKLLGYFRQLNEEGKIQALAMMKSLSEMEPFREEDAASSDRTSTA